MSSPNLLETALKCVQRGWYIFPLQAKGKRPDLALCPHWSTDSTNDPERVREWWTKAPDANIGVDLGKSNLTVLDFDAGNPPANLGLPQTLTIRTSRGSHVYFLSRGLRKPWNRSRLACKWASRLISASSVGL